MREEVAGLERRSAELAAEVAEKCHVRDQLNRSAATSQAIKRMKVKARQLLPVIDQAYQPVEQEGAAGELLRENLDAVSDLFDRTGVVVSGRPASAVLGFPEDTYIGDKLLSEDHRRHVQGYARLFAKMLGDRPLNTFKRRSLLCWVRTLEKIRTS